MATHKASAITIDEYEFPKGSKRVATLIGAALVVLSARRQFIEPRSILHDHVLARSAKAAKYSKPVQDVLFYYFVGVHGLGTVWFALTQLRKYNVKVLSPAWFSWVLTVFFGGSFATKHWDEFVEQQEIQAVKQI